MLSEITQTEKDKCINHLYMKPKKYNKPVKTTKRSRPTNAEHKLMVTSGEKRETERHIEAGS